MSAARKPPFPPARQMIAVPYVIVAMYGALMVWDSANHLTTQRIIGADEARVLIWLEWPWVWGALCAAALFGAVTQRLEVRRIVSAAIFGVLAMRGASFLYLGTAGVGPAAAYWTLAVCWIGWVACGETRHR